MARPANELARLLRTHLRPHRGRLGLLLVLQVLQTAALLYLPTINADIIDNGVLTGDTAYILRRGALMIAITVLQVICLLGAVRLGVYMAMAVGRDLRGVIFEHVLHLSVWDVGRVGTPSLTTRTVNDVQQIQTMVTTGLTMMVTAPVMGVGGVVLALRQDVPLAILLLVMVPLLGMAMLLIIRRLLPLQRVMQQCMDAINRVLREQVTGARVVRAFTREEFEQARFAQVNAQLTDVALRSGRLTTLMLPLAATVMNLFSVPIVWLGAYRVDAGQTQIGALTAFLGYLTLILVAVTTATFTLMTVPRAEACAERIAEVLRVRPSVAPPATPVTVLPRPGHLDLRGVEFRLPGAQAAVLRGVDLVARPGQTTAVVGSTGSGKSTLVNLVARLADVTSGQVLVGGVDVRHLDRSVLARAVALVPQTPSLFAGTVASNLRYARPHASDAELWQALEIAQAREFVENMDGGLSAEITQGGANLSGGQRQRLTIARALVLRPQIYLFDDSFSALDYETEARLRLALARCVGDATVVLVSQRVASLRDAERIVVLESGAVVGTGTHDELLATNDVYQEIVRSQMAEEVA